MNRKFIKYGKNNTGCRQFFRKGFRDVEFHISCFQSWGTEPTEVVIEMYVSDLKGNRKFVRCDKTQMTDMGRIDAVAYRMYYTVIMMGEYQMASRFNRIGRVTYHFSDIGPYLWASEQIHPHNVFQRFNRYYFKNKLALMRINFVQFVYEGPEDSRLLCEKKFRAINSYRGITDDSLGISVKDYMSATMNVRKDLSCLLKSTDSTKTKKS